MMPQWFIPKATEGDKGSRWVPVPGLLAETCDRSLNFARLLIA
jgi:hypothetical protein